MHADHDDHQHADDIAADPLGAVVATAVARALQRLETMNPDAGPAFDAGARAAESLMRVASAATALARLRKDSPDDQSARDADRANALFSPAELARVARRLSAEVERNAAGAGAARRRDGDRA